VQYVWQVWILVPPMVWRAALNTHCELSQVRERVISQCSQDTEMTSRTAGTWYLGFSSSLPVLRPRWGVIA
jgi:hypothetical protein